ncbi:unnamed protein product, partial [Mesorhabditis belari]|uniref:Hexosyltransferase n=1 Tax=Mesorhabditis belari TaxID=2138241 RepID=A0AAF3FIT4_9BILA
MLYPIGQPFVYRSNSRNKLRPFTCRLLLPSHLILIVALFLFPLFRFLFLEKYDLPFTNPDQSIPLSSDIQFLLEPQEPICSNETNFLIMIVSRPTESRLRQTIRESWGNLKNYDKRKTRILFLMGVEQSNFQASLSLLSENELHNDIVLTDIHENYYNLSMKTFALLQYKHHRCPRAKCLVKSDSDNVMNIQNFEKLCESTGEKSRVMGRCDVSRRVMRRGSKWAVPLHVYPFSKYPQYCSTGIYLFTGSQTASLITQATKNAIFFQSSNMRMLSEDVLFTGIFAEMAGVERENLQGFSFFDRPSYDCVNGSYLSYSLHMNRRKEPLHYWKRLRLFEGKTC